MDFEAEKSCRRKDPFGSLCVTALYLWVGSAWVSDVATVEPQSLPQQIIAFALFVAALYPAYIQTFSLPAPINTVTEFLSFKYVGRFIFLTRLCLYTQVVHQFAAFLASLGFMSVGCNNRVATGLATIASFVTIQFFVLVSSTKEFSDTVKMYHEFWDFWMLCCGQGTCCWPNVLRFSFRLVG
eukprot:GEMP01080848.1.p1 GENE.GEMP01080848.1~~GEMP01080848.1.p1  ORF type:complete len:212 (+),score=12.03 GEMP01080848.1:88-636(+)